jgi:GT2 family glycosyltransferase
VVDLTVIIVTYNSEEQLPACAAALDRALAGLAARVVVVDSASADESAAVARTLWPAARVIERPVNTGFAAGVNAGLVVAEGRAALLLNPDAAPEPGAIRALLAHLDAQTTAGIVAPRLLDAAGRPILSCYPFLSLGTIAWRHWQVGRLLPDRLLGRYRRAALDPMARDAVSVGWAQGACLLLRRAMLDQIGLLDERFVLYCEEVDLCRRAALAGWRVDYLPAARVGHREGSSSGRVVPLKLASHYFSKALYFDKHHPGPTATAARAMLLVDLALRSVFRAAGAALGRPPDAARRLRTYVAVAGALLTDSPARLQRRWQAQAAAATPRRAADSSRA